MKKILFVVGTRPNFMKLAPIIRRIKGYNIDWKVVHTGQHYSNNMSDVFFKELNIPYPNYNLNIHGGSPGIVVGKITSRMTNLINKINPDLVVVFGDVSSTVAAAMAAKYLHVKVAHVESGLRSFDWNMPEEINRIITDRIADIRFISEPSGIKNLKNEGLNENNYYVGNIMINNLIDLLPKINKIKVHKKKYGLITFHRPRNVDSKDSLLKLIDMLNNVSEHIDLIYPVHPRTMNNLIRFKLINNFSKRIFLTQPMSYLEFMAYVKNSTFVMTDSGGVQEETTYLKIPCLTVRPSTERPITVKIGTNTLVPLNKDTVLRYIDRILNNMYKKGKIPKYWDDKVGERILGII